MLTLSWIIFIVSVVNNPKLPPSADSALLVSIFISFCCFEGTFLYERGALIHAGLPCLARLNNKYSCC